MNDWLIQNRAARPGLPIGRLISMLNYLIILRPIGSSLLIKVLIRWMVRRYAVGPPTRLTDLGFISLDPSKISSNRYLLLLSSSYGLAIEVYFQKMPGIWRALLIEGLHTTFEIDLNGQKLWFVLDTLVVMLHLILETDGCREPRRGPHVAHADQPWVV